MTNLRGVASLLLSAALLAACGGSSSSSPSSRSIYVDVATGADTNAGTSAAPFKTLTRGLEAAGSQATASVVYVAPGTYDASSGETFPLSVPNLTTVVGSAGANVDGAGAYVVSGGDMGGDTYYTTFVFAPGVQATLEGITADGVADTVVFADAATVTLDGNTFSFSVADGTKYPVWFANGSVGTVRNNTITGWVALDTADATTTVTARNNSFDGAFTICTADFTSTASQLDLGTTASPGNNTILHTGSGTAAINNWGGTGDQGVSAVGNTWTPSVQGADASGHYTPQHVAGPTASGPNFYVVPDAGIDL